MGYKANIICDSLSPDGVRLTTFAVTYPHFVHKDIMTHRMLSRNFQSFRAIKPELVIESILTDPVIPEFNERAKGMQGGNPHLEAERAKEIWMGHVFSSVRAAKQAIKLNISKDQINQILQDLTWITGIITATDWDNFWNLRTELDENGKPLARPEVHKIVSMMKAEYLKGLPTRLKYDDWAMPYIFSEDKKWAFERRDWQTDLLKLSTARCARVSYLTHEGKRDPEKDLSLHDQLFTRREMSAFEHCARPLKWIDCWKIMDKLSGSKTQASVGPQYHYEGNFRGFHQYRKDIPGEACYEPS